MSNRKLRLIGMGAAVVLLGAATPAGAAGGGVVDCHATGGQREGQEAWTVRHLAFVEDHLVVTGDFRERYVLACSSLDRGLLCSGSDGDLEIVMVANGVHVLESIADRRTGREQLAHSYLCEGPVETGTPPAAVAHGASAGRAEPP
jgi:hypothetical protein